MVLLLMALLVLFRLGDTSKPSPVSFLSDYKIWIACLESGTIWGVFIFIRSGAIRHWAASKSNSLHCAYISSLVRTKVKAMSLTASLVKGCELLASIARNNAGSSLISMRA